MIVNCEFKLYGGVYYCIISGNQEILISEDVLIFQGQHQPGMMNEDVNLLMIEDCKIPQLPQSIGDTFKNIKKLEIRRSNLKSLTKFDLKQFENLKEMYVYGNDVEFLPGDLFEFTRKIEEMHLWSNKIKFIGPNIFDGLENLKIVNLNCNANINSYYDPLNSGLTLERLKEIIRADCKPPLDERKMLKAYGRDPDEGKPKVQQDLVKKRSYNFQEDDEEFYDLDCAHGSQHDGNTSNQMIKRTRTDCKHLMDEGNPKVHQKLIRKLLKFHDDFKEFLELDDFKDFTIKVADREFKVHKFLFTFRSQTFAEYIKSHPEAERWELPDIPVEVFEYILSFVYTDELPETQNIHEVFAAAGKLKMKGLIELTAGILRSRIKNEKNLLVLHKIMSLAKKFEHEELKLKAFGEIRKHFPRKNLKDELADQPDKLNVLINAKLVMEQQLKKLEI